MKKSTTIICSEDDTVDISVLNKESGNIIDIMNLPASELVNALMLYKNTLDELNQVTPSAPAKEHEDFLSFIQQGSVRALFYTEMEGTRFKMLNYPVHKHYFENCIDMYEERYHEAYSEALGQTLQGKVIIINTLPVFSLIFSDGSRYDHGNLKKFTEDYFSQDGLKNLYQLINK